MIFKKRTVGKKLFENNAAFFYFVVLFAIYAFAGWLIEVVYRSVTQRKFINAGFLHGPFIPIYAVGAFFILLVEYSFRGWHPAARILIYGFLLTLLEYVVGYYAEKIFKLKLWDYSDSRINLHGRVSFVFSLAWVALAVIFILAIHPAVSQKVFELNSLHVKIFAISFITYFLTDFLFSVISITRFKERIAYLYAEYFNLDNIEIEKISDSLRRLSGAFPYLNKYINDKINSKIKVGMGAYLKTVQGKIIMEINGRRPYENEYYQITKDIFEHEEFNRLKDYFHHNSSIYEHVKEVAYLSYRICKYLKLDYRSAARGALLHDYFFYDWRNHDEPHLHRKKFHGLEHPKIALHNAKKTFSLNKIEEDIIRKHMWPLTAMPPRYKESFIVSFADKYLSSKEFVDEFKKRINQRLSRKKSRKPSR
ncbi:MAG: HD domain-containing protein [Syntrophaceae bacterium]|nr:HD domain-containing protein [Syntrophaceae bacterium]